VKQSAARNLQSGPVNTIAPAPSGAGIDVLVLTEDDLFLLGVRRVVTLPNRTWHATSESQAADMLLSTPCAVALLDYSLVHKDLEAVARRLRQQFPDLGFVVAGEPEDEQRVTRYINAEEVQGFVLKAEVTQDLAGAIEAAINKHLELKSEAALAAPIPPRNRIPLYAGIAAAALVAGGVSLWLLTHTSGTPGDAATANTGNAQQSANPQLETASKIEAQLQKAREAFEAGRYVDPKNNNAADYYRAALALDANNAEARDGLVRLTEVMLARAEAALLDQKPRDATTAIKIARTLTPAHPRIAFLEAQLAREAERSAAQQQESARVDANGQKLASLIKLGNDRLNQDRLIEPASDSAKYYFSSARDIDGASLLAQQGLRSLANKMLQKGSQAATRGDADGADRWLAQARALNVSGIDFAKAERDIKSGQRNKGAEADRLLGLARDRLNQGQLLDPASDSARYYVATLQQQFPDYPALPAVVDSLKAQLLTGAEEAAKREDVSRAQRMLEEARKFGASGAGLESAVAAVGSAQRRAEAVTKPIAVREDMIVKRVNPDYPPSAERKGIEGFVDMQFVASATGEVKDIIVTNAQPQGVFEGDAMRALKRWKFKPMQIDGAPHDQLMALRMRFTVPK
jgi:TonB family protein